MAAVAVHDLHRSSPSLRRYPVICDAGDTAAVAVLLLPCPPAPGTRFWAFGAVWEVVRRATLTRGAVAYPIHSLSR
ncbi:MAG: hypothetical protein NZ869_02500 [Thermoanaerobaculum sp.]|nr:hypothetical protein [Thermoanaerobaculum sp.]MDW7967349.1 hypothetical protein [Thermoanaerobaculum sp.]